MIKIAPGLNVHLHGVQPVMFFAAGVINEIFKKYNSDCFITSGMEGKHSQSSRHYTGNALDFRTMHLSTGVAAAIQQDVREALGAEFFCQIESTPPHMHVQFNGSPQ